MVCLDGRAIIRVSGKDAETLLQTLITTNIASLTPDEVRPGALLTPQGKILFDFLSPATGSVASGDDGGSSRRARQAPDDVQVAIGSGAVAQFAGAGHGRFRRRCACRELSRSSVREGGHIRLPPLSRHACSGSGRRRSGPAQNRGRDRRCRARLRPARCLSS